MKTQLLSWIFPITFILLNLTTKILSLPQIEEDEEGVEIIERTVNMEEWDNRVTIREGFVSFMHSKKS